MGAIQEQESNVPLLPMDPYQHHDPPPYAYTPLSPITSQPSSPLPRKSVLLPPPESPFAESLTSIPRTPSTASTILQDPLLQCDRKFTKLVIQKIILPRLRVGVLKWKDRETLEFYPQNKEDRKARIRRTKVDEELGFVVSEYKFRLHAVEALVEEELENMGYKVRKMRIKEKNNRGICVKWRLKEQKGRKGRGRREKREEKCCGCCCC